MKDRIVYAVVFALFVLLPAYAALSAWEASRFEALTGVKVGVIDAMLLELSVVGVMYPR